MAEQKENLKYIVRIAGRDLNGSLTVSRALIRIKGIGPRMAQNIALAFEKQSQIPANSMIGGLTEEQEKKLEEIIMAPQKFGIPGWSLNRQKDYDLGENIHLVTNELDFALRQDFQRLGDIKSYRGLRHMWGLTVRGQRTRSTHRGKGGVVGVMKKDAKQAAKPAVAAAASAGTDKKSKPADAKEKKK